MVGKLGPEDLSLNLKFGGGLHTRASPDQIDGTEAASGFNFTIDIDNHNLTGRAPFDLIGTVPNAAAIRGAASLLKTDGTVTTIFQAGNTIYKWDGLTGFTNVGSCSAGCKLRGNWKSHTWNLTDVILITDLTLTDPVYIWDGTTFSAVTFTNQAGGAFGTFKAKYCNIISERAMFANVVAGAATPHMIVGAKRSDYTVLTIVNRPSNSLGTADPWFLLSPDLKPINGWLATYRGAMISTVQGEIFALGGTDSTNFAFTNFYSGSYATGAESPEETGNDFIYGRQGRIESVRDTLNYGNSEAADLTLPVFDQIKTVPSWTNVFNSRTQLLYCFPSNASEVWVMNTNVRDTGKTSPWMRYKTGHALAFQPTMVMTLLDPRDGLEYIIMGDGSGNIYRMEGTGLNGDAGTQNIDTQFLSKLFSAKLDERCYDVEGYIKYVAQAAPSTVTLTFRYQGENVFANQISTTLDATSAGSYFGVAHYKATDYYNTFAGQLVRKKFAVPGLDNEYQVLVEVSGANSFSINEIGIRLRAASS